MAKENIVDICRSIEKHFELRNYSVSLAFVQSLNGLNGNSLTFDNYSPQAITFVRFLAFEVPPDTIIALRTYIEDSGFVEIYKRHKERYGKEFVVTTWKQPILLDKIVSDLEKPPQIESGQHCDWLGKLYPCGGLNNNLNSMMNGLIFSYFTGMAYLTPEVPVRSEMCYALKPCASFNNKTSWFKKTKSFSYIWDLKHLERHAKWLGIKLENNEPECVDKLHHTTKKGDWMFLNDAEVIQKKYSPCTQSSWSELFLSTKRVIDPSCYQGLVEHDCMFASFKPTESHYWGLWALIRNSFKFSSEILDYADRIVAHIGRPFISFHLRIEQDVELEMTRIPTWDKFWELLPARFKQFNISTSDPVVIVSGLRPGDPKRALTIAALGEWNLLWPEHFQFIYETLEDAEELERRAAIQYALCLRSSRHFGFYDSSFDVNLHVDRRLRDGHFSHNVFSIVPYEVANLFQFFKKTVYPVLLPNIYIP